MQSRMFLRLRKVAKLVRERDDLDHNKYVAKIVSISFSELPINYFLYTSKSISSYNHMESMRNQISLVIVYTQPEVRIALGLCFLVINPKSSSSKNQPY